MKKCSPPLNCATNVTSKFSDHVSPYRKDVSSRMKRGYWSNKKHRKEFFDWLGNKLGINGVDDMHKWYSVTAKTVVDHGGTTLLRRSVLNALRSVYPNYNWEAWRFEGHTPRSFWCNLDNQRRYLEWVAKQQGYKSHEDWYDITSSQIIKLHGKGFISTYKGSVYQALKAVYPEYQWKPWKFRAAPKNYWSSSSLTDQTAIATFVQELTDQLNIIHLDDWYRVSVNQIREFGFQSFLRKCGNLYNILKLQYPDHPWDFQRFNSSQKKSGQRWLHILLKRLFPSEEILEEYHHPDLLFSSKLPMELDIFFPNLKLAFEYQGRQHYDDVFRFAPQKMYESRDIEKKHICTAAGITLIEIPYWWDRSIESLVATIKKYSIPLPDNPSLNGTHTPLYLTLTVNALPIPTSPPERVGRRKDTLMASEEWKKGQDISGWWMTEKLDGLRVLWDGKRLVTKRGKVLRVPQSFLDQFPVDTQLDGELWGGHGEYLTVMDILFGDNPDTSLFNNKIKFVVLDAPLDLPYTQRLDHLKKMRLNHPLVLGEVVQCRNIEHMKEFLQQSVQKGGEGVLAWHPLNKYQYGNSDGFVHVMAEYDTHVKVVGKHPSLGLLCQQVNGAQCMVRCPAQMFINPPPQGTIITVKHAGYFPTGRVKYPLFSQIQEDLQWDEIVRSTETVPFRGKEPTLTELVPPETLFEQKLLVKQLKNSK